MHVWPKSGAFFRVFFELINHADLSSGAAWPPGGLEGLDGLHALDGQRQR